MRPDHAALKLRDMEAAEVTSENLRGDIPYFSCTPDNACLDGDFTAAELLAITGWMLAPGLAAEYFAALTKP